MSDEVKNTAKGALRSKTIWFAIALAIFGAVLATLPLLEEEISPIWYGVITMFISVIVAVLRVFTTVPLGSKA